MRRCRLAHPQRLLTTSCLVLFLLLLKAGGTNNNTVLAFHVSVAKPNRAAISWWRHPEQFSSTALHSASTPVSEDKHVDTILFVECGFGADAHGQDSTKAAVRACRNAIEFNQIPSISNLVPGGRENMKLDVLLAVPKAYQEGLECDKIRQCFPYGQVNIQLQDGGMVASSGVMIPEMGDRNDDMVVVCVAVTVGY